MRDRLQLDVIDDMASTLLEICHLANSHLDNPLARETALMASKAIDRWKAGTPEPRLTKPLPG